MHFGMALSPWVPLASPSQVGSLCNLAFTVIDRVLPPFQLILTPVCSISFQSRPETTFSLPLLVLGSSDLFLPGINCRASCQGHRIYNTNASSSSQALGRNFSLAYGDGSTVQGDQFRDSVTIANLTVKHTFLTHPAYSSLTCILPGDKSNSRRSKPVFVGFRYRQVSSRWSNGNGIPTNFRVWS